MRFRFKDEEQASEGTVQDIAPSPIIPLFPLPRASGVTPAELGDDLGPRPAAWIGRDHFAMARTDDAFEVTPPSLAHFRDGFDDRALSRPKDDHAMRLWRLGRWLGAQTTRRPQSLQIIDDWTVAIDRRVVQIDEAGNIRDLSPQRSGQGTRLASLACWGRRR